MAEYWNAELETMPWAEVERRQAGQVAAMLPALVGTRDRSRGARSISRKDRR